MNEKGKEKESVATVFRKHLAECTAFDMIVGYFRISGFKLLYKSFEKIGKIRILVGLNVDSLHRSRIVKFPHLQSPK